MHPRFLSVFPRLILIPIVFLVCGLAVPVYAIPAPEIVIEDTLVLGAPIASVELDTVHFSEESLLVGTDTNSVGVSYAIRFGLGPLRTLDTLFEFDRRVTQVRAGYVDTDERIDFLIGLDSMFWTDIGAATPSGTYYPMYGKIRDILIDDDHNDFWVASERYVDTSWWIDETWHWLDNANRWYDSVGADPVQSGNRGGGADLLLAGVRSSSLVIAFWREYQEFWGLFVSFSGYALHVSIGCDTPGVLNHHTLYRTHSDGGWGNPYAYANIWSPVAVGDVDGDGAMEGVVSSTVFRGVFDWLGPDIRLMVVSMADGTIEREIPTESRSNRTEFGDPCSLWDLDGDGLLDIVRWSPDLQRWQGFKGNTGDTLFSETPARPFDPPVVANLDQTGVRKGVMFRGDTLFIVRLDMLTGTGDEGVTPEQFELFANYPNPFNAATAIEYSLDAPGKVRLDIFNVLGRHVETLVDGIESVGRHRVRWEASGVGSGVYFYRLTVGDQVRTRKMVVLK